MKKMLAFILAIICLLSCAVPALAADKSGYQNFKKIAKYTDDVFSDVKETSWYHESVAAAYELGLMQGGGNGKFNPQGNITLAETLVLADKLHSIFNTGRANFVEGNPWYQTYVDYALKNGILPEASENYGAVLTRSEFVAILARALPKIAFPVMNDVPDGTVPDVPMDSANAAEIYMFYRSGVLAGNDRYGHFTPESPIQRSAVAAIVTRIAYRSLRLRFTLEECLYPDLTKQDTLADEAYFADAAMLGNSLVDGMELYSGLSMAYYGGTGYTVYKNRLNDLLQKQFGKVYIEFGINELGGDIPTIMASYKKIVEQIHEKMPDAQIYLMAVTPVTKTRSDGGTFTMKRIGDFNAALHDLAAETSCWYLDTCTTLCDSTGYLPEKFGGWDGSPHLSTDGYKAWADVIRNYYA